MQTLTIQTVPSYPVKIARGLLSQVGAELSTLAQGQVFVVTDSNVAPLYLSRLCDSLTAAGFQVSSFSLPAGEASKNLQSYTQLLQLLAQKHLTRANTILALGGGVVSDLAGFAAATYLRGLRWVIVPTTLLAMVDAAVGGKTGLDLPAGKNLVGAVHQPAMVLCDPQLLDTLPAACLRDGCAEVIKYAILADPQLFSHLRAHGSDFDRETVILRCLSIKAQLIAEDAHDHGRRRLLNLGHTVAHAIEQLSGYSIPHGCAVAIGLAVFSRSLCRDSAAVEALLQQFSLPLRTQYSAAQLCTAALSDKKRSSDGITLVVPHAIGQCTLEAVSLERLRCIIEAGL